MIDGDTLNKLIKALVVGSCLLGGIAFSYNFQLNYLISSIIPADEVLKTSLKKKDIIIEGIVQGQGLTIPSPSSKIDPKNVVYYIKEVVKLSRRGKKIPVEVPYFEGGKLVFQLSEDKVIKIAEKNSFFFRTQRIDSC